MSRTIVTLASIALLTGALALPDHATAAKKTPPETTHDGLVLRHDTKLALVYLKPGADFAAYDKIALLECAVAFKKNWQREQNQSNPLAVSKKDMDEIKSGLAELFAEVFSEELAKGGYATSTSAAEDVLILRPAILDLDIAAPAAAEMGRSRTFSTSAGQMTLYLEVYDSSSGEILARVMDRREATDMGRMMWQNAATNRNEAKKLLRKWATTLREGLDALKIAGSGAATGE
jgi:hypothetical protein